MSLHSSPPLLHFADLFSQKDSYPLPFISLRLHHISIKPRSLIVASAVKNLSDVEPVSFPVTPEEFAAKFPSDTGVYAVFDQNDELQYIGVSSNIAGCHFTHKKSVPELCCSVRVGVVNEPEQL